MVKLLEELHAHTPQAVLSLVCFLDALFQKSLNDATLQVVPSGAQITTDADILEVVAGLPAINIFFAINKELLFVTITVNKHFLKNIARVQNCPNITILTRFLVSFFV